MRVFETILKLLFLLSSMYLTVLAQSPNQEPAILVLFFGPPFFLLSFILGLVLIFNKKSSYNYPQSKRDYAIRKTEGGILIIFSVVCFSILVYSILSSHQPLFMS